MMGPCSQKPEKPGEMAPDDGRLVGKRAFAGDSEMEFWRRSWVGTVKGLSWLFRRSLSACASWAVSCIPGPKVADETDCRLESGVLGPPIRLNSCLSYAFEEPTSVVCSSRRSL
jgi:hypothetical protein